MLIIITQQQESFQSFLWTITVPHNYLCGKDGETEAEPRKPLWPMPFRGTRHPVGPSWAPIALKCAESTHLHPASGGGGISTLPEPTLSFGCFTSPSPKAAGAQLGGGIGSPGLRAPCAPTRAPEVIPRYERKMGLDPEGRDQQPPARQGEGSGAGLAPRWAQGGAREAAASVLSWAKSAPNGEALETSC